MGLVDYLSKAVARTRASFSGNRDKMVGYLMKYELPTYFNDLPADKRAGLQGALEQRVDAALTKYDKELGGILRKGVSKGSMGLAIANDVYAYISNAPLQNITGLGYALFGIKTAAEIPALYRYLKKSHDWYGAISHMVLKPLRYLIPIVGPALESGAFERMVRKRVMNEAKSEFIKEYGNYVPFEDHLKEQLKVPASDVIYMPPVPNTAAA